MPTDRTEPAQSAELIEALLRDTPRSGHEVFCGIDNGPCDCLLRDGVEEVAAAAKAEGRREGYAEGHADAVHEVHEMQARNRLLAQSENTEA